MITRKSIAIQLAGQIRDWDKAFAHWQLVQEKFESAGILTEFFISTWSRTGIKNSEHKNERDEGPFINIDKSFFTRYYISDLPKTKEFTLSTTKHMVHHWTKSTLIRMNYELEVKREYDAVMIVRPDLMFKGTAIERCINMILEKGPSTTLDPRGVYTQRGSFPKHIKDRIDRADLFSDDMWVFGHRVPMNYFILIEGLHDNKFISHTNHSHLVDFLHKLNLYNWSLAFNTISIDKNVLTRDETKKAII